MSGVSIQYSGVRNERLENQASFEESELALKVQKLFFSIVFVGLAALSATLIPVCWPLGLFGIATFSYCAIKEIVGLAGTYYRSFPTEGLFSAETERAAPALGEEGNQICSGFFTRDGIESHAWKLNLIRAAKHTIFLSGCYCGGRAFDEALDLIHAQMENTLHLNVSILASELFVTEENQRRIDAINAQFKERFQFITTPEFFPYFIHEKTTLTTQHTKALVIDYGSTFLVGGSGIVSSWSEQSGTEEPIDVEHFGLLYDHLLSMRAFRDMDFVFQFKQSNSAGTRLYLEMEKLFQRFSYTHPALRQMAIPEQLELPELPHTVNDLKISCYASGPEKQSHDFLEEMIRQVDSARANIVIGHMYFHPPNKLLEALINASNRGVSITLITNKMGEKSPGSHFGHAELSHYYAKSLFEGRAKENIAHFEYDVPYTTYHKKVVLFDGKTTLLGSSNIGEKSMKNIDYEINFKIESEAFASALSASIEQDKTFCQRDDSFEISLKTRVFSAAQSLFTPFL